MSVSSSALGDTDTFDWYISPSNKFAYEQQFARCAQESSPDHVTIQDLEQLYAQTHLPSDQFLQMWAVVDIWFTNRLNKEQFIYLSHILSERRKGKPIPVGLPLSIKEDFLRAEDRIAAMKSPNGTSDLGLPGDLDRPPLSALSMSSTGSSQPFVRPIALSASRDLGASLTKSARELETEIQQLSKEIASCEVESRLAQERADALSATKTELLDWESFTNAVNDNIKTVDALPGMQSVTAVQAALSRKRANATTVSDTGASGVSSHGGSTISAAELSALRQDLLVQKSALDSIMTRLNIESGMIGSLAK